MFLFSYAKKLNTKSMTLEDVVVFRFNKENKMDMRNTIKTGLALMSCVCLYNVLTTYNISVFLVSIFIGIFSTWTLLSWERDA